MKVAIQWVLACAFLASAFGQPANVVAGKVFLSQLTGDPASDAAAFQQIGNDRAQQLLSAVMSHGQSATATRAEWADMHRAIDGIVALNIFKGDLLKASVMASFNDIYYRNNEKDRTAALAASLRSLDLLEQSNKLETLYLSLSSVGENLLALGRVTESLAYFRRTEQHLPDPFSKFASVLHRRIVQAIIATGDLKAARAELDTFFRLAEKADWLFRARAFMAESDLLFEQRNYVAAIDRVKAALTGIPKDADDDSLSYEASAQLLSGVVASMRSVTFEEALEMANRIDSEIPGLFIQVAPFARQAIRTRRRLAGEFDVVLKEDLARLETARKANNAQGQIEALRSLAVTYSAAHGIRERITVLEEAVELERHIPASGNASTNTVNQQQLLALLNGLGFAYLDANELTKARRMFNEVSKAIAEIDDAMKAERMSGAALDAILGKARTAELDDEPEEARSLLEKALAQNSTGDKSEILMQLARMERKLNEKPAAAVAYSEQAIEALRASRNNFQLIAIRLALARYLATTAVEKVPEARTKAEAQIKAAEAEMRALSYADGEWRMAMIRGNLAQAAGEDKSAIALYRAAIERLEKMRSSLSEGQRQDFSDAGDVQELYQRIIGLLSKSGNKEEAWQYLERAKARSFVEMLGARRFKTAKAESTPVIAELQQIERRMADLELELAPTNATLLRSAGREPGIVEAELRKAADRFTVVRQQAEVRQSRSGQVLSLSPPSLVELQKRMPGGALLIEYGIVEDGLTAFLVTSRSANQISWKTNTKALRQKSLRIRPLLASANSGDDWKPLLAEIAEVVLKPLETHLTSDVKNVIIVPAGALSYLPFQLLLDRYTVSYLPSGSTLAYLPARATKGGKLFLGALGNTSVSGMAPLPGTLVEVANIAKAFPPTLRLEEKTFTRDSARNALEQYDQVHFATHGILDERAPLFSALLTSPAPNQPSRLSLYEITEVPLKARLVVLSACETGLGKLLAGDEVVGLTRTFLSAGANTVVSSLWKVSDESTALLMESFYRNLSSGKGPAEAMHAASTIVRAKYPHPFYWAPFVVTGSF